MTIANWLDKSIHTLSKADVSSPRLDCLLLLEELLVKERSWILAHDESTLNVDQLTKLNHQIDQRKKRIPLAQILGWKDFYGHRFFVNDKVLIPRPETEVMVEKAAQQIPKNSKVLEIGTGSGCIGIALKLERDDLSVTISDISSEALVVANKNAKTLKSDLEIVQSDLFAEIEGKFDCILANLPYVPTSARRQPEITHEPALALFSGHDGLELYKSFFNQVDGYLNPKGSIYIEASPTQYSLLKDISKTNNFIINPLSEYIFFLQRIGGGLERHS